MGIHIGTSTKNQGHISLGDTSYGKVYVGDKLVWQKDTTPVVEDFIYKGEVWEYGTVTSPTGRVWMDRNLGASRPAEAINDPEGYGDYFQWGRGDDLHQNKDSLKVAGQSSTDSPGHGNFILVPSGSNPDDWRVPQNNSLWQGVGGINTPAPTGWRLPTAAELQDEISTWSTPDNIGAFSSILKWPCPGRRQSSNGIFNGVGYSGEYWSSDVYSVAFTPPYYWAKFLLLRNPSFSSTVNSSSKSAGRSIRLIKD